MEYLYILVMFASSVLIMLRSIIYIQMDNYRLRIRGKITREFLYNLSLSIALLCVTLIAHFSLGYADIYYGISISNAIIFAGILASRRYKVAPKFTHRLQRLIFTFLAINFLFISILLLNMTYFRANLPIFMISDLIFVINYAVLLLALLINKPLEDHINNKYILNAKLQLESLANTKVIAITGSYAKTTIKNMLTEILSTTYKVKCTPQSYNTPLGIALSISELDGDEDYFIVEMGARQKGDIKTLCDMVHPQYGIITSVAEQHIETFKTIDNVASTKYELYESIPSDGMCVFSGFDSNVTKLYDLSDEVNSLLVGKGLYYVDNILTDTNGSSFTMHINGEDIEASTTLIGRQNIENILLASVMAHYIGVNNVNIAKGIARIEAVPHRLEVTRSNGITIIDDSYNANIKGVMMALDALSLYNGRKIVATQGIVEGGKCEADINIKIGRYIAKSANIAVIIGRERKYILKGLIDSSFNMQNIVEARTLKDAEKIFASLIRSGDTLLITNDLPDNY